MREIKFRAWDRDFKKWSDVAQTYAIKNINYYTDYEWSQYTGLKDKDGVEIYEGDVLAVSNKSYESKGEVFWSNHTAKWLIIFQDTSAFELGTWGTNLYQIIGNIYENPELLEGE